MTLGELTALIDGLAPAILKSIEGKVAPLAKELQELKVEVSALRERVEGKR